MKDIFFYWSGEEPKQSFNDVKRYFPTAKFIEYKDNPVATALVTSKKSLTKQFWLMDIDYLIANSIKNLDLPEWDQSYAHIFSNDILNAYLVPKQYTYSSIELDSGIFENKKIVETSEVYYRPYEMYFYWSGPEPTHKIKELKKLFPTAKFVEKTTTISTVANTLSTSVLTDFYWLIDIDLVIDTDLQEFRVPKWDYQYAHVFANDKLSAYLVPLKYSYDSSEFEEETFNNKKIIETTGVTYRQYDLCFYWTGIEPTHKITAVKEIYPWAKFVKRQKNPVNTASAIRDIITTDLFWLIDIDLIIVDELLKLRIPDWDHKYTHVFASGDISAYLIPLSYSYDQFELIDGQFANKKVIETDNVVYRPYELYFYWNGIEPTHKFEGVKKLYPSAKFIKYKKNPVNTARDIKSTTRYFWLIDIECVIPKDLQQTRVPIFDQKYVQVFITDNRRAHLVPSEYQYEHVEIIDGHFSNKKIVEVPTVAYRPYDIFFLSYDEDRADTNWEILSTKYSHAKRVHGVKGIFNAHLRAAEESTTDFFWVVDADATVREQFKFDYRVPSWDFDVVHIWNSRNAVNRLEYGYGGVKLIPKFILLMRANSEAVDVTTSIGNKIKLFDQVSNINDFATSPFSAWRAGFREAVKLSSAVINRQDTEESRTRLEIWCNVNVNHPYGDYVVSGAKVGKMFGTKNQHDQDQLALINDYKWLEERFDEYLAIKRLNHQPLEK